MSLDHLEAELTIINRKIAVLEADNTTLKLAVHNLADRVDKLESGSNSNSNSNSNSKKSPVKRKLKKKLSSGSLTARGRVSDRKSNTLPINNEPPKTARGLRKKVTPSPKKSKKLSNGSKKEQENGEGGSRVSYYVGKRKIYVYVPKWYHADPRRENDPPASDLQLDFIYGYNGRYARRNLFYTDKGRSYPRLIYCIAGVGVYYDPVKQAQSFFTGHNNDISSLALHPTKPIVATGQLDPTGSDKPFVCIWDYTTMQLLVKLSGFHDRAIAALDFSSDGEILISIGRDDNNVLAIWQWSVEPSKPLIAANTGKDAIHGITINPYSQDGTIQFATFGQKLLKLWTYELISGKLQHKVCSSFEETKTQQKNYFATLFLTNSNFVVGCGTGDIYMFSSAGQFIQAAEIHHEKSVGALCSLGDTGFVSAGNDGLVRVYDTDLSCRTTINLNEIETSIKPRSLDYSAANSGTLVLGATNNSIYEIPLSGGLPRNRISGHFGEVWALATHPSLPVTCTGGHDKCLRCWDYKQKCPVPNKVLALKSSIHSASFSPDGKYIVCGLVNGKVVIVEYNTFEVTYENKHRQEQIDCISFSPNGQLIALGSWDQCVELIETVEFKCITLHGHTSSVTHLTFSVDSQYLMTNSRDYEILFWNCATASRADASECADVRWYDWKNVLGWPVKSIFSKGMDGTDINAVSISGEDGDDERVVAVGDDFGRVHLFNYPAVGSRPTVKRYPGHSSHVTNVRFSSDDTYLFTTGGQDMSVFQWRVRNDLS